VRAPATSKLGGYLVRVRDMGRGRGRGRVRVRDRVRVRVRVERSAGTACSPCAGRRSGRRCTAPPPPGVRVRVRVRARVRVRVSPNPNRDRKPNLHRALRGEAERACHDGWG